MWQRKTSEQSVRPASAAGRFYPADPVELRELVSSLLAKAPNTGRGMAPKALIVPHAGYVYSGPVAASAYARLKSGRKTIRKVVMVGPAHFVYVPGLALPAVDAFETPLGVVPVSGELVERVRRFPFVKESPDAHAPEHSLEVQLPFLQTVLEEFELLPLLAGQIGEGQIAEVLDAVWGGVDTCLIISSDLSHFLSWPAARQLDGATARAIEHLQPELIGEHQACGRLPIKGFLKSASAHGLEAQKLDLRNSGDTAGGRDRVVGYGAFAFESADAEAPAA